MSRLPWAIGIALGLFSSSSFSQTCPASTKILSAGGPCIAENLFNYLYCIEKSGGGKIEIVKKENSSSSADIEVKMAGEGSGILIKGGGSGSFSKKEAAVSSKELSEKLDPNLVKNCATLLAPSTVSKRPNFEISEKPTPSPNGDTTYSIRNIGGPAYEVDLNMVEVVLAGFQPGHLLRIIPNGSMYEQAGDGQSFEIILSLAPKDVPKIREFTKRYHEANSLPGSVIVQYEVGITLTYKDDAAAKHQRHWKAKFTQEDLEPSFRPIQGILVEVMGAHPGHCAARVENFHLRSFKILYDRALAGINVEKDCG
jgi:hypothetical protein